MTKSIFIDVYFALLNCLIEAYSVSSFPRLTYIFMASLAEEGGEVRGWNVETVLAGEAKKLGAVGRNFVGVDFCAVSGEVIK